MYLQKNAAPIPMPTELGQENTTADDIKRGILIEEEKQGPSLCHPSGQRGPMVLVNSSWRTLNISLSLSLHWLSINMFSSSKCKPYEQAICDGAVSFGFFIVPS